MKKWHIVISGEQPIRTMEVQAGNKQHGEDLLAMLKELVILQMRSGRCCSFVVAVHVDGAGCDHQREGT